MLANILIALGFLGTGIFVGLGLAAWCGMKKNSKKSVTKKVGTTTVTFVYDE